MDEIENKLESQRENLEDDDIIKFEELSNGSRSDNISENSNEGQNEVDANSTDSDTVIRPRVEWIYPSDYESSDGENDETVQEAFVVDPHDVYVEFEVEGQVVHPRRCFLKVFGFEVCNDVFPYIINPKLLPFLYFLILCGVGIGICFPTFYSSSSLKDETILELTSSSPSFAPSFVPVVPRIANITNLVHGISGDVAFLEGSSQYRALNWILYDDPMNLTFYSTNLVQRYVLMVMFYNLSGENWKINTGYESGENECIWFGIECSLGTVGGIVIDNNNLRGQIPGEMGHLSDIMGISFMHNGITGSIPSEIGKLRRLEFLRLVHNSLTGPIPEEISRCKFLSVLRIHNNKSTGSIPTVIGKLRSLTALFLNENQFSGTIPSEIGNLRILQSLNLAANKLTGTIPPELGQASLLNNLQLWDNKLDGKIPMSFENLSDMIEFVLMDNLLEGSIPTFFFEFPRMKFIVLNKNKFTGSIPTFSASSSVLEQVHLSENELNGTIPESFGTCKRLEEMTFQSNNLRGTLPPNICNLSLRSLEADCGGEPVKLLCSCCTKCF